MFCVYYSKTVDIFLNYAINVNGKGITIYFQNKCAVHI